MHATFIENFSLTDTKIQYYIIGLGDVKINKSGALLVLQLVISYLELTSTLQEKAQDLSYKRNKGDGVAIP